MGVPQPHVTFEERGFVVLKPSEVLRVLWSERHTDTEPSRADLQRLGDDLRREKGSGVLIDAVLERFLDPNAEPAAIAFDGIRNVGEIQHLQNLFGYRFFLIAVLSSFEGRWARIGASAYTEKGLTRLDFLRDDQRDSNEEVNWGQQVQLCIDKADVLLNNSGEVTLESFQSKVLDYVDLLAGSRLRPATTEEIVMNIAFSSSHSSKCLKRHVGAVVVDPNGRVAGVGYNENPIGTNPCAEEPEYGGQCFRDIIRNDHSKSSAPADSVPGVCERTARNLRPTMALSFVRRQWNENKS